MAYSGCLATRHLVFLLAIQRNLSSPVWCFGHSLWTGVGEDSQWGVYQWPSNCAMQFLVSKPESGIWTSAATLDRRVRLRLVLCFFWHKQGQPKSFFCFTSREITMYKSFKQTLPLLWKTTHMKVFWSDTHIGKVTPSVLGLVTQKSSKKYYTLHITLKKGNALHYMITPWRK